MVTTERDRLRQMLLDRSMRFGEFVLSSGATSNYYIDVRKTSLHPEGLKLIARLFWEQLGDASLDASVFARVPADLEIAADDGRLDRIADAFALIIDAKSPFTFDHSRRVASFALAIPISGSAPDGNRPVQTLEGLVQFA